MSAYVGVVNGPRQGGQVQANQYPQLALDPDLPEPTAQLMRTHPHLLRAVRGGWTPRPLWPVRVALLARTGILLLIVTSLLILPVAAAGDTGVNSRSIMSALTVGLLFGGGFLTVGMLAELLPSLSQVKVRRCLRYAHEHPGSFVLPDDLDEWTRPLLWRAQQAAEVVFSSEINLTGMLDSALNTTRLRDEAWQVARRLAELSKVAGEYTGIVGQDVPGEFAEAYRPYKETLRTSFASLRARVEAIEDYAAKVLRADRHYEVYRNVERLREHNPSFERLRAEIVGDALDQVGDERLTLEVTQVERQLQESIEDARQAAGYLLDTPPGHLPPPDPRP
jgi:hypothetical protein